jgi:hypothetical protein
MPTTLSRPILSRQAPRIIGRCIGAAWVLLTLAAPLAFSEPLPSGSGPDIADLRTYLECSVAAEVGLLAFDEAAFCSTVFMKVKLSFLPDVDLDRFNSLQPHEKFAIDHLGYKLYLDWKEQNAKEFDALISEIRSSQADS